MKKLICLAMAAAMSVATFCACGQSPSGNTPSESASSAASGGDSDDVPVITYFRPHLNKTNITYWSDTLWIQELEKRMNIKFDFNGPLVPDINDYYQAVNILLASNDLPDLLYHDWNRYNGGLDGAIKDGIVVNVSANEEYRSMLPTWFGMLESNEMVYRAVTLDDGTSALFCHVEEDLQRAAYEGYCVREDWLKNVGMEVPTTIDELYTVLKAFKEQDANGNGDPNDEIPMTDDKGLWATRALMAAWGLRYGFEGSIPYPDPDTGKITHMLLYKNGEAFSDFITTMNRWYQEGLVDPDFSSQDGTARTAKVSSNKVGFAFAWPADYVTWRDAIEATFPDLKGTAHFYGLSPLVGPAGKNYTSNDAHVRYAAANEGTCIMPTAEKNGHMEAILRTIDYMYTDEGSDLINWGVEGVSYTVDADGKKAWTETVTKDPTYKFNDKVSEFAIPTAGQWPKKMSYEAWKAIETQDPDQLRAHENYWNADTGICMPPLILGSADANEYTQIITEVNTAVSEFMANAIVGTRPLSDLPGLIDEVKGMGLERAMEIYQVTYDRYMSK